MLFRNIDRFRLVFPTIVVALLVTAQLQAQPRQDMRLEQRVRCQQQVALTVGERSLVGWVGPEMVSFIRHGSMVLGYFRGGPVTLEISGTDQHGYWLSGEINDMPVKWQLKQRWVSGQYNSCPHPSQADVPKAPSRR